MKAYGHSRSDMLTCKFGCCTTKSGKRKNCRALVDRANRKTARQSAKLYIRSADNRDTGVVVVN